MKCPRCGKELVKVGELTENEIEELTLINTKMINSNQALDIETIKGMEFTDGQVFEYFRAAYDCKAQADFLRYMFFRNLAKRLNIKNQNSIQIGDMVTPEDYNVYIHSDKE